MSNDEQFTPGNNFDCRQKEESLTFFRIRNTAKNHQGDGCHKVEYEPDCHVEKHHRFPSLNIMNAEKIKEK